MLLTLLLSGCSDLFSVNPLATAETTVFDAGLLGEWSSEGGGGAAGKDLDGSVLVRAGAAERKEYEIVWIPKEGEALRLRGQLVRVGDRLIFDLLAIKEANWAVPGHFFMLMERGADGVMFHWLDSDWLRQKVMLPNALAHAVGEDKPVIVAGGAQINAFLAKYGLDPQAVSVTATLKLVKQGTAASVTLGATGTEVAGAQSLERNR
jgi:hypothetical protein